MVYNGSVAAAWIGSIIAAGSAVSSYNQGKEAKKQAARNRSDAQDEAAKQQALADKQQALIDKKKSEADKIATERKERMKNNELLNGSETGIMNPQASLLA